MSRHHHLHPPRLRLPGHLLSASPSGEVKGEDEGDGDDDNDGDSGGDGEGDGDGEGEGAPHLRQLRFAHNRLRRPTRIRSSRASFRAMGPRVNETAGCAPVKIILPVICFQRWRG